MKPHCIYDVKPSGGNFIIDFVDGLSIIDQEALSRYLEEKRDKE